MKGIELQKILETVGDVTADALDHLAKRFANRAEKFGDEYSHLAEFGAGWQKLSKKGRRLFAEQFLKSSALVIAGTLATKAALAAAGRKQKQVRAVVLTVADMIEPTAKKLGENAKKKTKKRARKAKKRLEKATN